MIDIEQRCQCGHLVSVHRCGSAKGCMALVPNPNGRAYCKCRNGRDEARDG
jgi:hypothetical protein